MNLILLHGALGAASQWETLRPVLGEHFETNVVELEGHGQTPANADAFRIEKFADQLAQYISASGLAPANIFGYSMGGYVALDLARRKPELVARIMTLATKFAWTPESAAREVQKLNPDSIAMGMPSFAATLQKRHTALGWRTVLDRTADMMKGLGTAPVLGENELASIRQPVCIGIGEWDTMVSVGESEKAAGTLPNGELTVFQETKHPLESVETDVLVKGIKDFFCPLYRSSITV
jgi:pimeloyl-ACP methyl ester carboxylesterase